MDERLLEVRAREATEGLAAGALGATFAGTVPARTGGITDGIHGAQPGESAERTAEGGTRERARGAEAEPVSRRSLLASGAAGIALAGFGGRARAQASQPAGPHVGRGASAFGDLHFLVDRITQGFSTQVWQEALPLGYEGFLEQQLAPDSIPDGTADAMLAAYPTLGMTAKQLWNAYNATPQIPVNELRAATVLRAIHSKRQLKERMVEFWTDHFNIDQNDGELRLLKTVDDREVIRAHALGNFGDLLDASMHSGAMLVYLDNFSSKKEAPNENYARELLELHTLGVGSYTEDDIKEVARCLTGWSRWPVSDPNYGTFRFVPGFHDFDAKTVLGTPIPAGGGESDGLTVHAILVSHPATAQFLARKMSRWLLAYEPPQAVVDAVAAIYLATSGDIKAMIRAILRPDHVAAVRASALPKLKRPFHLVASVARALGVQSNQPTQLATQLGLMGHLPFAWQTPDGYSDTLGAWGGALLPRWTFVARLTSNTIAGHSVDVATLFSGVPQSGIGARVSEILAGGTLDPLDAAEIQAFVDTFPSLTDAVRREALALGASSPSFQYY